MLYLLKASTFAGRAGSVRDFNPESKIAQELLARGLIEPVVKQRKVETKVVEQTETKRMRKPQE
jgi:hypothetical protein